MQTEPIACIAEMYSGGEALDPITVFWVDYGDSRGSVTITCWGSAWTCYFGGMGGDTIKEFFRSADAHYLINKLGITPLLKQSKKNDAYLGRIISAVKESIKQGELEEVCKR